MLISVKWFGLVRKDVKIILVCIVYIDHAYGLFLFVFVCCFVLIVIVVILFNSQLQFI